MAADDTAIRFVERMMRVSQIAAGAEARMGQLSWSLAGGRPGGVMGALWEATGGLRARAPALQYAMAAPVAGAVRALSTADVVRAVGQGFRVPGSLPCSNGGVPREGARLLGHVEEASGEGVDAMMGRWVEERLRLQGRRGLSVPDAVAAAMDDTAWQRRFGAALADAALGVPGARVADLPEGFTFSFHPEGGRKCDTERAFARLAGQVLVEGGAAGNRRTGTVEAARLLGRIERRNGAAIDDIYDAAKDGVFRADELDAFCSDCAKAALGREHGHESVSVPVLSAAGAPREIPSAVAFAGP